MQRSVSPFVFCGLKAREARELTTRLNKLRDLVELLAEVESLRNRVCALEGGAQPAILAARTECATLARGSVRFSRGSRNRHHR